MTCDILDILACHFEGILDIFLYMFARPCAAHDRKFNRDKHDILGKSCINIQWCINIQGVYAYTCIQLVEWIF